MNSGGDRWAREVPKEISREEVKRRISIMFNLAGCHRIDD
jgi:hypothetical protein